MLWLTMLYRTLAGREEGEIPAWVMIVLMTAGLVVSVWAVARERLVAIVSSALSTVCGTIGC